MYKHVSKTFAAEHWIHKTTTQLVFTGNVAGSKYQGEDLIN